MHRAITGTLKRKFVGLVRTGCSSTNVKVEANDEAAATKLLKVQYGTENIIEVCGEDESNDLDQMSQAESGVGRAVMLNFRSVAASVAQWMLRGSFKK
jgi:hypothetical protein